MQQSVQTLKSCLSDLVDSLALPMIGEIKTISFSTVPNGWAKCDGQLLNILDYGILFGLIGTTYGGDGVTTFALPNLQGKTMIHNDANYALGQTGGTSENTLTVNQLPTHSHGVGSLAASHTLKGTVLVNEDDATTDDPISTSFGLPQASTGDVYIYNSETNTAAMAADNVQINGTISLSGTTASTGNGTPVNNVQPYLALNTIIALEGIDPSTI